MNQADFAVATYDPGVALEFFRSAGKPANVAEGEKIFAENERAIPLIRRHKMYLLLKGEVGLSAGAHEIRAVKAGEIFGEMAALARTPRSATAVAKTPCRVIALDAKQFRKALAKKPEFALMLMGMMILRLRGMLARLAALPGGAAMAEAPVFEKQMLASLAKGLGEQAMARHAAGTVLFKEGSAGVLMYVVLEGRVAVSIKGQVVGRVGPGGMFGEMALVDQAARAANASAETDCALLAINRTVFMNLVKANPEFGAALLGAVAKRVRSIAERLK